MNYLRSTFAEMKKVIWPTRSVITWMTIIVVLISIIIAYYLGAFDLLFRELINLLV